MKEFFDILCNCSLFHGLSREDLSSLLTCLGAKTVSFHKNKPIFSEGSSAHSLGIMLSGSANITRVDFLGNRSILGRVYPSELVGESFACSGVPCFPVDVIASEVSTVMLINADRVMNPCCNACDFHRILIYNLVQIMAKKNLAFHQKIEVTSKRTTREKLMTYLLLQAKKHGTVSFSIPYNRQELADYLEVDRSGLSTEISKLRAEGILTCTRNHFHLLTS